MNFNSFPLILLLTPLFPLLLTLPLPLPLPPSHYIKLGHARQRTRFGGFFFQSSFPARSRVQRRRPTYTAILALRHICCRRDSAALHRPVAPCPTYRPQCVRSGPSRPILPWPAIFSRVVTFLFHVLVHLYLCPAQFAPVPPTNIESCKSCGRTWQSTRGKGKDARERGKEALQRARLGGTLPRKWLWLA